MLNRAQVEAVLRPLVANWTDGKKTLHVIDEAHFQEVLDRLCALTVTQPDRDKLEQIIAGWSCQCPDPPCQCRYYERVSRRVEDLMAWAPLHPLRREDLDRLWEQHDWKYGSASAWRAAMKDAIWALVQGKATRPIWCAHLSWHDPHWYFCPTPGEEGAGETAILGGAQVDEWKVCPLCAAPRPTER